MLNCFVVFYSRYDHVSSSRPSASGPSRSVGWAPKQEFPFSSKSNLKSNLKSSSDATPSDPTTANAENHVKQAPSSYAQAVDSRTTNDPSSSKQVSVQICQYALVGEC